MESTPKAENHPGGRSNVVPEPRNQDQLICPIVGGFIGGRKWMIKTGGWIGWYVILTE
jgi:hypothetical protein